MAQIEKLQAEIAGYSWKGTKKNNNTNRDIEYKTLKEKYPKKSHEEVIRLLEDKRRADNLESLERQFPWLTKEQLEDRLSQESLSKQAVSKAYNRNK